MGNCAGYCNGQGEQEDGQVRHSFTKQDMINNHHEDFAEKYGKQIRLHLKRISALLGVEIRFLRLLKIAILK